MENIIFFKNNSVQGVSAIPILLKRNESISAAESLKNMPNVQTLTFCKGALLSFVSFLKCVFYFCKISNFKKLKVRDLSLGIYDPSYKG